MRQITGAKGYRYMACRAAARSARSLSSCSLHGRVNSSHHARFCSPAKRSSSSVSVRPSSAAWRRSIGGQWQRVTIRRVQRFPNREDDHAKLESGLSVNWAGYLKCPICFFGRVKSRVNQANTVLCSPTFFIDCSTASILFRRFMCSPIPNYSAHLASPIEVFVDLRLLFESEEASF